LNVPRLALARRLWSDMQRTHKDLQVCRQVFDALSYALAELDDPVIDALVLVSVTPAPNAARVLVTLAPARGQPVDPPLDPPLDQVDLDQALARLREVAPELREEVAAEVARRRVPELVFRIDALTALTALTAD
jgi:ribosome-binding factor A